MPRKPAAKKKTARRVRVRTFRHGLGDCHLVTFRKSGGAPFHILIDCGVVNKTEEPKTVMEGVAKIIKAETGGALDLVVATHQHWDHLSGFLYAKKAFEEMKFARLWLAWTEDPAKHSLAKKIQDELVKKLAAVRAAAAMLKKAAADGRPSEALARIEAVLGFYGLPAKGEDTQEILDALQAREETAPAEYLAPQRTFLLPEVPGVRVYVLGPPENAADMKVTDPRKTKKEGYEPAASANGLVAALDGSGGAPFDERHRLTEAEARQCPELADFFKEENAWRNIDHAWLAEAEQLALYLSDYTNNTSLALAFEFTDTGEVLLFPGDAQIGSWLTWPRLVWKFTEADGTRREVRVADLFKNTVFYKVSHHASHNGTMSGYGEGHLGFEHMIHRDLVCVVPVDRKMSEKMGWDRTLPWKPLLDRMRENTRGRLILTDKAEPAPDTSGLTPAERKRFAARVKIAAEWVDFSL
jgi:hypothetical protein